MGVVIFVSYLRDHIRKVSVRMDTQDVGVALALYFVYPAILWLLIDKFHGICGPQTYLEKQDAIDACHNIYIYFTALMRTHKLATIILFQADACGKQEDFAEDYKDRSISAHLDDDGCTKLKCRVWFHLTQELVSIFCVSFLLIICLPVLAFYFMFLGIIVSICNIFSLLKRLWRVAHIADEDEIADAGRDGEGGDDLEFKEFLSNFSGDD